MNLVRFKWDFSFILSIPKQVYTIMGILKLLTGGLCGILWIYDMVTIQDKVRNINFDELMRIM